MTRFPGKSLKNNPRQARSIPESDYPQITTLRGMVEYLAR